MIDHLTTREKEIIEILKKEPMVSQDELAEKLGITRSAAAVHISNLMRKGSIAGRGYIFNEGSGILVVGETGLEIRATCNYKGRDHPDRASIELAYAGNACLLALELARRQLEPVLLTFLGKDPLGDEIYQHLLQKGISARGIIRSSSTATGKRLVITEGGGDTRLLEDSGSGPALNRDAVSFRDDLIRAAKILLLDGDLPGETLAYLASGAAAQNTTISVVNCPLSVLTDQGLLSHRRLFHICTAGELSAQAGTASAAEPEELFPACRRIVGEGCQALVVIYGDQGLILASGEETVFLPASPLQSPMTVLEIVAGVTEGLSSGYKMRMAVRRAMGSAVRA